MKRTIRKLLSFLLAVTMVLSLFSGATFGRPIAAQASEDSEATVEFLIKMNDSYGDGWSGCGIGVYEGNTLVTVATFSSGASAEVSVPYIPGLIYTFQWVKGEYADECSFEIWINGELLAQGNGDEYADGETITILEELCNHEYESEIIPPTCTDPGFTRNTCTLCGKDYVCDEIPATGHIYEDDMCTVCGHTLSDDFSYICFSGGTCGITDYIGNATHLTIPSMIDGCLVTSIQSYAFKDCSGLIEITIPDSVTTIGWSAFNGCSSLTEINIPDGITSIENYAFKDCSSLTKINIPDGVTSIADSTFAGCSSLTEINIPDGVTSIGDSAFEGCFSLTEINIPDGVTSIEYSVFRGCSSLTKVTIPDGVTSIGAYAFKECYKLTEITIPDSVTSIGADAFAYCTRLSKITFRGSAPQIAMNSFDWVVATAYTPCGDSAWSAEHTVNYAGSITWKVSHHFTDFRPNQSPTCTEAGTKVGICSICGETGIETVPATGHTFVNSICTVCGCDEYYYDILSDGTCIITGYKGNASVVTVPSAIKGHLVTGIGDEAFYGYSSLTEIIIPDSVMCIGEGAFSKCGYLTEVTLSGGVTSIANDAFSYCSSLTKVTIPDGVTSIGAYAFKKCYNLTEITIPASVTSIGTGAFMECVRLVSIAVDPNNSAYTSDGAVLFSKDAQVLFAAPSASGTYTIPDGVTSIGDSAFVWCESLTGIVIPDSVTSIGDSAFMGCSRLAEIIIPDSVASIGDSAFTFCYNLTEITIPNSVTFIGNYVFHECELDFVAFLGNAPQFGLSCFYGISTTVYYPAGNPTWTEDKLQKYDGRNITWIPYDAPETGVTLSGKLTSFGSNTESLTVELWTEGAMDPAYTAVITDGSYSFENIPEGNYTLKISMEHGVTRSYLVETGSEEIALDVKISPLGDISGDGKLNVGDVARAYSHARGSAKITDDYAFSCGDINGDGKINVGDVAKIYGHTKGTSSIW